MKYWRILVFSFCFLFLSTSISSGRSSEATQTVAAVKCSWDEVVQFAQEHLSLEGTLIAKSDGFVYVKVDNEYIHTLFPLLGVEEEGYAKPPYFRSEEAPGAHISVFYESENIEPEEIGQTFHFELKQIAIVYPSKTTSYVVL